MPGQRPPNDPDASADDSSSGTIEDAWPWSGDLIADEKAFNKFYGIRLEHRLCTGLSTGPSPSVRHLGSFCNHDDSERRTWRDVCFQASFTDVLSEDFETTLEAYELLFNINRASREFQAALREYDPYMGDGRGDRLWTGGPRPYDPPEDPDANPPPPPTRFGRTVRMLGECPAGRHCEGFTAGGAHRIACVRNDGRRDDDDDGRGKGQQPRKSPSDGSGARRRGRGGSSDDCGQHGRAKLRRTGHWHGDGGNQDRSGAPVDEFTADIVVDADMHGASLEALIFDAERQRLVMPEKHVTVSLNGQKVPLCVMPITTHTCEPLHQYRLHQGDKIEFTLGLLAASLPAFLDYGLTSLSLKSCTG